MKHFRTQGGMTQVELAARAGIHRSYLSELESGHATKAKERLSVAYTPEAQRTYDVNTPLLSISSSVGPRPFSHDKARPFFDGLLPERETRRMLAFDFRLQEDDTFGFLRAFGRDCAGALVVLPEGEVLPSTQILKRALPLGKPVIDTLASPD